MPVIIFVSILSPLALGAGIIFIILPDSTVANPFISSTDSNTLYASLTDILVGEIIVTFPLTPLSTTKFLPVNLLMNFIKTLISTLLKSIETNLEVLSTCFSGIGSAAKLTKLLIRKIVQKTDIIIKGLTNFFLKSIILLLLYHLLRGILYKSTLLPFPS